MMHGLSGGYQDTMDLVLEGYMDVAVSTALLQMLRTDPKHFTEIVLGLEWHDHLVF